MSARAAWRLESLGFTQVFHYTAGKADWFAAGLPREGTLADSAWSGDMAQPIATCHLSDRVGAVRDRLRAEERWECVVVNEQNVVLGRLRRQVLESNSEATAEQVMESGPATIRPSLTLQETADYLQWREIDSVLVTTSDGTLMGVLYRKDIERALNEIHSTTDGGG